MPKSKPIQRLYIEDDLTAQSDHILAAAQAHYVRAVLRAQAQDTLLLFNGRDGEWQASVSQIDKKQVVVCAKSQTRQQDKPPDIWLVVAPIKRARLDYLAQKATEMGVARLMLVQTQHTQNKDIKMERLRANAIEAAEQCGLLHVPEITPPQPLPAMLRDWDASRALIFCDETTASTTGDDAAHHAWQNVRLPCAVLIGAEGGFAAAERTALYARDYITPLRLGSRILRTDTAVVAALALVQSYIGDWRK